MVMDSAKPTARQADRKRRCRCREPDPVGLGSEVRDQEGLMKRVGGKPA